MERGSDREWSAGMTERGEDGRGAGERYLTLSLCMPVLPCVMPVPPRVMFVPPCVMFVLPCVIPVQTGIHGFFPVRHVVV